LLRGKKEPAKTARQVKIEFVHRRPGGPMWMGYFGGALEEIAPPDLTRAGVQRTGKSLHQRKRDEELQCPAHRGRDFRLDDLRERRLDLHLLPERERDRNGAFPGAIHQCRIGDVIAKQGAAAIELEVEVAAVLPRLDKELHRAVLIDGIEVVGAHTTNIPVAHLENAMEATPIIQQPRRRPGPMPAAFRPEMPDFQRFGFPPGGVGPVGGQGRGRGARVNPVRAFRRRL